MLTYPKNCRAPPRKTAAPPDQNGRATQQRWFNPSLPLVRFDCAQDKVPRYFAKSTEVVLLKYRGGF
jgi:hypothetical protein